MWTVFVVIELLTVATSDISEKDARKLCSGMLLVFLTVPCPSSCVVVVSLSPVSPIFPTLSSSLNCWN